MDEERRRTEKIEKYKTSRFIVSMITYIIMGLTVLITSFIIASASDTKPADKSSFWISLVDNSKSSDKNTAIVTAFVYGFIVLWSAFVSKLILTAICDHVIEKLYMEIAIDNQTEALVKALSKQYVNADTESATDSLLKPFASVRPPQIPEEHSERVREAELKRPQEKGASIPGTIRCKQCGTLNPDDILFCEKCTAKLN